MTGTWALVRLALRRDRWLLPVWIVGLAAMATFSVAATRDLYPTEASLESAAAAINATAALVALYGQVYDPTSLGALSLIKMTAFGAAIVAIVFALITVRHTRGEEDAGRLELVESAVVGRHAPLAAALAVGGGASLLLGALTALGLMTVGLPAAGSVAFGLSWAMSGLVFTAVAGVCAQVMSSSRPASGMALAVIAAAYVLRAVGDLGAGDPGPLSWLSPIGWSQQIRPFAGNRWWVLALPLVAVAIMVPLAFALRSRRDLGAGFIADRPGPRRGRVGGVVGVAWRLQRATVVAWAAGVALMGLVLGSVAHSVSGLLDSPAMAGYLEALGGRQGLTDAFLAAEVSLIGALVGGFAVAATVRLRAEESSGRLELLLSAPLSRVRWAGSHLVVVLVSVAGILLIAGAAIGLGHGLAIGDPGQVGRLLAAAAAQIPAAWVMAALVVLVFGFAPRATAAAGWGLLVAFIVIGEFGPLWQLPTWVLDISPFAHSPRVPSPSVDLMPLIGLLVAVLLLLGVGLAAWRRRDVRV